MNPHQVIQRIVQPTVIAGLLASSGAVLAQAPSPTENAPRLPTYNAVRVGAIGSDPAAANTWSGYQLAQASPTATDSESGGRGATLTDDQWQQGRASTRSWIPYTSYGYVGLNLGKSEYNTPCVAGFSCDNPQFAGKIYTGGLLNRIVGLEVGYINLGNANRNGGRAKAQGANLSVVGNLPIGWFNTFAKIGTTYAWSEITADPASGVLVGKQDAFGLSLGAGVGFDLTRDIQLLAEWDRNRIKFVSGRDAVDLYSLGVKYKF